MIIKLLPLLYYNYQVLAKEYGLSGVRNYVLYMYIFVSVLTSWANMKSLVIGFFLILSKKQIHVTSKGMKEAWKWLVFVKRLLAGFVFHKPIIAFNLFPSFLDFTRQSRSIEIFWNYVYSHNERRKLIIAIQHGNDTSSQIIFQLSQMKGSSAKLIACTLQADGTLVLSGT